MNPLCLGRTLPVGTEQERGLEPRDGPHVDHGCPGLLHACVPVPDPGFALDSAPSAPGPAPSALGSAPVLDSAPSALDSAPSALGPAPCARLRPLCSGPRPLCALRPALCVLAGRCPLRAGCHLLCAGFCLLHAGLCSLHAGCSLLRAAFRPLRAGLPRLLAAPCTGEAQGSNGGGLREEQAWDGGETRTGGITRPETCAPGTRTWDGVRLGGGTTTFADRREEPGAGFWSMEAAEGPHVQGSFPLLRRSKSFAKMAATAGRLCKVHVLPRSLSSRVKGGPFHLRGEEL